MRVPFRLLLVSDRQQLSAGDLIPRIESALAGGVDAVQLREKDLPTGELYQLARQLRAMTTRHRAKLLINDRIDIALAVQADGVHLPGNSFQPREARQLLGPERLIGVSTHSLAEARAATSDADYIVFGPIYETPSKQGYGPPQGLTRLTEIAAAVDIPVFGIGGVQPGRVSEVCRHGAAGVAVIAAILSAGDTRAAAAQMRYELDVA